MLDVLDVTEDIQKNREKNSATPTEMFCSSTTLTSFRLTINSAMALAEEMLANDYHTVLTGKWNQDTIPEGKNSPPREPYGGQRDYMTRMTNYIRHMKIIPVAKV